MSEKAGTRTRLVRGKNKPTESKSFDLYEALENVLRDLERIDKLIPCESSRTALMRTNADEGAYIIEARKNELLGYIQTICKDNIWWGRKAMEHGWKEGQSFVEQHKVTPPARRRGQGKAR